MRLRNLFVGPALLGQFAMINPVILTFFLSSFLLAAAFGQPPQVGVTPERKPLAKAVLKGTILDMTGKAIAGAKVTVGNDSTVTGPPGSFRLEISVPDTGGTYRANVEIIDYRPKSTLVKLMTGDTTFHDFVLVLIDLQWKLSVRFKPKSVTIDRWFILGDIEPVVRALKDNPELKIEIQGHCFDWVSKRRNLKTSQVRAEVIRKLLLTKGGIDSSQIVAKGYGSSVQVICDSPPIPRRIQSRIEIHSLQ